MSSTFGLISLFGGLIGVFSGYILARYWQSGVPRFNIEPNQKADPLVCAFSALIAVLTTWLAIFLVKYNLIIGFVSLFFLLMA